MRFAYICDKCESENPTEEAARHCESLHRTFNDPVFTFRKYGQFGSAMAVPQEVVIRFSDAYGDFGVFKLVQHGPRGM